MDNSGGQQTPVVCGSRFALFNVANKAVEKDIAPGEHQQNIAGLHFWILQCETDYSRVAVFDGQGIKTETRGINDQRL